VVTQLGSLDVALVPDNAGHDIDGFEADAADRDETASC